MFADATLTVEDDRQDYGEVRYITIGFLDEAMVVFVWTRRNDVHRIISMRRARTTALRPEVLNPTPLPISRRTAGRRSSPRLPYAAAVRRGRGRR